MDSEIEDLLTKYWNCETTLEEEQRLRTYFRGQVPDHLADTANLFRYFTEEQDKALQDDTFDRQIMKKVHATKGKTASLIVSSMRIAAGIAVLIAAVWLVRLEVRQSDPAAEMADTYSDPKIAFEETKKALMMISRSFGAAEEQAKKINLFNEAQQEIRKTDNKPESDKNSNTK